MLTYGVCDCILKIEGHTFNVDVDCVCFIFISIFQCTCGTIIAKKDTIRILEIHGLWHMLIQFGIF